MWSLPEWRWLVVEYKEHRAHNHLSCRGKVTVYLNNLCLLKKGSHLQKFIWIYTIPTSLIQVLFSSHPDYKNWPLICLSSLGFVPPNLFTLLQKWVDLGYQPDSITPLLTGCVSVACSIKLKFLLSHKRHFLIWPLHTCSASSCIFLHFSKHTAQVVWSICRSLNLLCLLLLHKSALVLALDICLLEILLRWHVLSDHSPKN